MHQALTGLRLSLQLGHAKLRRLSQTFLRSTLKVTVVETLTLDSCHVHPLVAIRCPFLENKEINNFKQEKRLESMDCNL